MEYDIILKNIRTRLKKNEKPESIISSTHSFYLFYNTIYFIFCLILIIVSSIIVFVYTYYTQILYFTIYYCCYWLIYNLFY